MAWSIGAVKETTTTTPASTATAFAAGKVWNAEGGVARRLTSTAATAVLLSGCVTRAVTGVIVVSVALPLNVPSALSVPAVLLMSSCDPAAAP